MENKEFWKVPIKNPRCKITWNIPIYDIPYKNFIGPKPLQIKFHKINGFAKFFCGKVKHELRVVSYQFRYTSYGFKSTSYEFKSLSHEFKYLS